MKDLSGENILLFCRTMALGGTENVVLQLCEILKPVCGKVIVCSAGGVNEEKLAAMGIRHYTTPDPAVKQPAAVMAIAKTLKKIVRDEHITVIHTHHRMAAFYVRLLSLHRRCRFLNTCHNTFGDKKGLTRFAYGKAELIACGVQVKKNLTEFFGLPEAQVRVVRNAVKPFTSAITPDALLTKLHDDGGFVVLNAGRLSEQKGMTYFIQAAQEICEADPDTKLRFCIAGAGELEAELKAQVHEAGIEDKVFFLGYRPDIQNLMAQSDLCVLSSLWEGLPLTPIEAFSVGTPVIATAVDGTMEIVRDRVNGRLVKAKDVHALAEAIRETAQNADALAAYKREAKHTYEDSFSFDVLKNAYLDVYQA